jgi:alpha-galactosidase
LALQNRPKGKERLSGFTRDEHFTLMTLWCIARSPLMMGGDLLTTPQETIQTFLQNEEVLAINKNSTDNRQIHEFHNGVVWIATDPTTGDRFVALFNIGEKTQKVEFDMEHEYMRDNYRLRDLWEKKNLGVVKGKISAEIAPHGARLYRLSKTNEKITAN